MWTSKSDFWFVFFIVLIAMCLAGFFAIELEVLQEQVVSGEPIKLGKQVYVCGQAFKELGEYE